MESFICEHKACNAPILIVDGKQATECTHHPIRKSIDVGKFVAESGQYLRQNKECCK